MDTSVLISIISGVCTIIGVMITANSSNNKMQNRMQTDLAVVNTKIENLTNEVRSSITLAKEVPILKEEIKELTRRIEALEKKD